MIKNGMYVGYMGNLTVVIAVIDDVMYWYDGQKYASGEKNQTEFMSWQFRIYDEDSIHKIEILDGYSPKGRIYSKPHNIEIGEDTSV
jgi:hypothetical protein